MAISEFNRNNTFVILMRMRSEKLATSRLKITRSIITYSLFEILLTICSFVFFPFKTAICSALAVLLIVLLNISEYANTMASPEAIKINKIIYGDDYSVININNEEILGIIEGVDVLIGKIAMLQVYFTGLLYASIILFGIFLLVFFR